MDLQGAWRGGVPFAAPCLALTVLCYNFSTVYRVLLADGLDEAAEARLEAGAEVVRAASIDEDTLIDQVADCDALIARTYVRITRRVLAAGRRLRVIGVAGVGLDRVDEDAARALGIALLNRPGAATDAVADLALALMLHLLRPIPALSAAYRIGDFRAARAQPHGRDLCDLTIGIVGMGRIGSALGRRVAACGARVQYNDIRSVGPFDFPARSIDKPTLWSTSDIITLHTPLTDATRGLVDAAALERMRPTALLINTARGAIVNTAALVAALSAGRLAGAGLDVTDPEPLPMDHALFTMDRCIVTPHIAARTREGVERMYGVVDDVLAWLHEHEPHRG